MAREMNVDRRIDTLRQMVIRTNSYSAKAKKIAEELAVSFKGDRTPKGKRAQQTAQAARKLATALDRVIDTTATATTP